MINWGICGSWVRKLHFVQNGSLKSNIRVPKYSIDERHNILATRNKETRNNK